MIAMMVAIYIALMDNTFQTVIVIVTLLFFLLLLTIDSFWLLLLLPSDSFCYC